MPASLARVVVRPFAHLAVEGCLLGIRYPPGFPALEASAARLAHELSCDFPLLAPPLVAAAGALPGTLEALVHANPDSHLLRVLYPVVDAVLVVLGARRLELAYGAALRRALSGVVYDLYGSGYRRRLAPFRG